MSDGTHIFKQLGRELDRKRAAAETIATVELLKLIRSLLRAQIEERRINSYIELEGTIKQIDEGLALMGVKK